MKRRIKAIFLAGVMAFSIGVSTASMASCDISALTDLVSQPARTLSTPMGLRIEKGSLVWNPVEYASRYTVSIDGREYF